MAVLHHCKVNLSMDWKSGDLGSQLGSALISLMIRKDKLILVTLIF